MGHYGEKLVTGRDEHIHAVVLSGGGAYGAYEVGAMKALFGAQSPVTHYAPLNARVFTGTSVGSFNAAFMSMEPGVESSLTAAHLETLWVEQISDNPQTCGNGVLVVPEVCGARKRVGLYTKVTHPILRRISLPWLANLRLRLLSGSLKHTILN